MLTKKDQTKRRARLRPDKSVRKIPKYLNWLHEVDQPCCFVCGIGVGIEMHHIKLNSSDVKKDDEVIPLCNNHHHGYELSPHGTPIAFRQTYSMQEQLEFAAELYEKYKITKGD